MKEKTLTALYIIDYGTVGGATHSFLEMVAAVKQLGVRPIVCLGEETDITEKLDNLGIEYFCAGHRTVLEPFVFKGLRWPYRYVKKYLKFRIHESIALRRVKNYCWDDIDIIHTNSARNDIGCFINKEYGIPHVMHIREFGDADFDCISFRENFIDLYNQYTTRFIAISDAVKKHWISKGIKEHQIKTIYNGIHYEDIAISSDEDKKNQLKIVITGGVCRAKGQYLAVEAFGLLPLEVRKNIWLDIVGWGSARAIKIMSDYAESRGYLNQIHFVGGVNDVHERLGHYQIGLMCSRAEGFGRVTAEYMHAQLGVIASDSGANPELIQDEENGLLFKSGDAKSLANCILKLYKDRELLIRISHAARAKALALYTQQKNAEAMYNLYNEIIKNN